MLLLKSNLSFFVLLVGLLFCILSILLSEMRSTFHYHSNKIMDMSYEKDEENNRSRQHAGVHFAASHEEFEKMLRDAGIEDTYENEIFSDGPIERVAGAEMDDLKQEQEERTHDEEIVLGGVQSSSIEATLTKSAISTSTSFNEFKYLRLDRVSSSSDKYPRATSTTAPDHDHRGGRTKTIAPATDSILFISVVAAFAIVFARKWKVIQK